MLITALGALFPKPGGGEHLGVCSRNLVPLLGPKHGHPCSSGRCFGSPSLSPAGSDHIHRQADHPRAGGTASGAPETLPCSRVRSGSVVTAALGSGLAPTRSLAQQVGPQPRPDAPFTVKLRLPLTLCTCHELPTRMPPALSCQGREEHSSAQGKYPESPPPTTQAREKRGSPCFR